jgi:hypothetical protein
MEGQLHLGLDARLAGTEMFRAEDAACLFAFPGIMLWQAPPSRHVTWKMPPTVGPSSQPASAQTRTHRSLVRPGQTTYEITAIPPTPGFGSNTSYTITPRMAEAPGLLAVIANRHIGHDLREHVHRRGLRVHAPARARVLGQPACQARGVLT